MERAKKKGKKMSKNERIYGKSKKKKNNCRITKKEKQRIYGGKMHCHIATGI